MQATDQGRVMYQGTGRRKSAIARVRLVPGDGQLTINGKPGDLYLQFNAGYLAAAKAPLETLGLENEYDIFGQRPWRGLNWTSRRSSPRCGSCSVSARSGKPEAPQN